MNYRLIFEGSLDPRIPNAEEHLMKAMESCFHLLWGYNINIDPSQCTFVALDEQKEVSE